MLVLLVILSSSLDQYEPHQESVTKLFFRKKDRKEQEKNSQRDTHNTALNVFDELKYGQQERATWIGFCRNLKGRYK